MLNRGSVGTAPSAASWDSDTSTKDDAYSVTDSSTFDGERRGKKHNRTAPQKENKRLKKNAREQRRYHNSHMLLLAFRGVSTKSHSFLFPPFCLAGPTRLMTRLHT